MALPSHDDRPKEAGALFMTLLPKSTAGSERHYTNLSGAEIVVINKNHDVIAREIPAAHSHMIIVVAKDVHATLIVHLQSASTTHAQEIFLEDGASLLLTTLNTSTVDEAWIAQRAKIGAYAKLTLQNAAAHPRNLLHDLVSTVIGRGGNSAVEWLFRAGSHEKARIAARNVFAARDCGGDMVMKGVCEGRGNVRIEGMIDIEPTGAGTDTYLTQDVLMLDTTAKVDAVPGLTIKTNDVKASHSATVSRVTAEDLFYFASRGIDEPTARGMYIEGYIANLVNRMPTIIRKKALAALL